MRRSTMSLVAARSLLTFPASAQIVNMELDRAIDRYTARALSLSPYVAKYNTIGQRCVSVPGRLNTAMGETILSVDKKSVIYKLLASLGQTKSHSGLALSSESIRHNTLMKGQVKTVDVLEIPQYLKPVGHKSFRDGWPGVVTQETEAATGFGEFFVTDGLVLYSASESGSTDALVRNTQRLAERIAVANKLSRFQGFYRLYAYTNIAWKNPYTQANNDGNMCSGSIFHAHRLAGNTWWTMDWGRPYSAQVRQDAAYRLYSDLRTAILDDPEAIQYFALLVNEFFGGTDYEDFATRAANQVVNCMAFNDCDNRTGRWRNGVGSGASLSPDDLLLMAQTIAFATAFAGQPNDFIYNSAKPLQSTGSYYCCVPAKIGTEPPSTTCDATSEERSP